MPLDGEMRLAGVGRAEDGPNPQLEAGHGGMVGCGREECKLHFRDLKRVVGVWRDGREKAVEGRGRMRSWTLVFMTVEVEPR